MKEFNFEKELLSVQDELFRFAYKLTADREKAEDLLQDTLLKAMLHKESYNKNTNFKGWLFIIMRKEDEDGPIPGIKLFKDFNIYLEREYCEY